MPKLGSNPVPCAGPVVANHRGETLVDWSGELSQRIERYDVIMTHDAPTSRFVRSRIYPSLSCETEMPESASDRASGASAYHDVLPTHEGHTLNTLQ